MIFESDDNGNIGNPGNPGNRGSQEVEVTGRHCTVGIMMKRMTYF